MQTLLLVAVFFTIAATASAQTADVTVKARAVIDGTGKVIPKAMVPVRDGKIVDVGPASG